MIIFINGSINSGKTTISKILAKKIPNTACIEVDDLRNFITWMPLEKSIDINLENALILTKNFIKHGLNVLIVTPLSKRRFEIFQKELPNEDLKLFNLNPSLEIALTNRGERELTKWEIERIKYHYQIGINDPGVGTTIDSTYQTPDQTAEEILSHLNML